MKKLKGLGIYPDIAFGNAYILEIETFEDLYKKALAKPLKIQDFSNAVEKTRKELKKLRMSFQEHSNLAEIIEFQEMLLEDDSFYGEMVNKIKNGVHPADAIYDVITDTKKIFLKSENIYMRERVYDIEDLGKRIVRNLLGEKEKEVPSGSIVISLDLTPTEVTMLYGRVKGIITERGSALSHFAIIARGLGIPTIVSVKGITKALQNKDYLILNGLSGTVIINPSDQEIKKIKEIYNEWNRMKGDIMKEGKKPAITADGVQIFVVSNIGKTDEAMIASENGAEGIGLFRTEFFFLYRETPPSEEEQYKAYKFVATTMSPHLVYIRTLDIGSDKRVPYIPLPSEPNPTLGKRAVRLYFDEIKDVIRDQIKAIIRASAHGKIGIMIPMISDPGEVKKVRTLVDALKEEVKKEGHQVGDLKYGIMVETPAAAVLSDIIAKYVDFMSIGTNDLTQYTLAVDRAGIEMPIFFDHLHPAVLRLIKTVVNNLKGTKVELSVCGESASDLFAVPILIGLGIRKLSVAAPMLAPLVKYLIRRIEFKDVQVLANKALAMEEPQEVRKLVEQFYTDKKIKLPIL
ncbi:MAG: phosphoenolpyruvate--protein phosphotransferase [Candidatus Njordarchaeia archaeon]